MALRQFAFDRSRAVSESLELARYVFRQVFNQIPGVSAAVGLMVGAWVASTFTVSPWKAALASWGLIPGGRHLVSGSTYRFLSVALPLLSMGVTAYLVQKFLKGYRRRKLERDKDIVAVMGPKARQEVEERLAVLDEAARLGLLSPAEHLTKTCELYAGYSRVLPKKVGEMLWSKLS